MKELVTSFVDWWKEKKNSTLYFTYLLFLTTWNWDFLFRLFIERNLPEKSTSFSYAMELYVPLTGLYWLDLIMYKIWDFFIPAIFTLLAIRYLPKLSAWAHGIEVKNFFERRLVYDSQRAEFEEKRTGFLNRVAKQKEAQ